MLIPSRWVAAHSRMQRVQAIHLHLRGWLVFSKGGAILGLSAYLCFWLIGYSASGGQFRAIELEKYTWIHVYLLSQSHDYSVHEPIAPASGSSVTWSPMTQDGRHQLSQSFCLLSCLVLLPDGFSPLGMDMRQNRLYTSCRLHSSVYRPLIQISLPTIALLPGP